MRDEVYNQFWKGGWGNFNLNEWILNHLGELLEEKSIAESLSTLSENHSVVGGPTIRSVRQAFIDDVRGISNTKILLSARADLTVEIAFGLKGEDYFGRIWLEIRTSPLFEGFWLTLKEIMVSVEFSLIVESATQRVVSAQIDEIEGEQEAGRLILKTHPTRS